VCIYIYIGWRNLGAHPAASMALIAGNAAKFLDFFLKKTKYIYIYIYIYIYYFKMLILKINFKK
jgi:hypothetical protein